jgi:pimeloyl-ACP methyl ester carboxylesterase
VLTAGERSKPPLVALHDMGFSSTIWLPLLPTLPAGHHIWMLDAVGGVNKSVATAIMSSPARVVEWIEEVLDTVAIERSVFVGTSIGAWMATQYALARPERVARLAMLAPAGIVGALRMKRLVATTVKTQFPPTTAKGESLLGSLVMERTLRNCALIRGPLLRDSSSMAWRTSGETSESRVRACGATSSRLPRAVSWYSR